VILKKQFVEETPFLCPKDGGKVIVKKDKKGKNILWMLQYPNATCGLETDRPQTTK